jgi:hypothetical protein
MPPLNPDYVPANIQEPATWTYDIDPANGSSRASYPGEVVVAGSPVGGPTTGTGAIVLANSPALTGNPTAPTPAGGDSDASIATTAFVQAALRYLNYADNSGFAVNQRTYVSGTALAAGIYGHDRWKAGAGGCTYTFAAGSPAIAITITAGTLQQVIEGASIAGGTYTLSWTGTAQGRVGAGAYAASPVVVSGIAAGVNTTIEFNTGTLTMVKFEAGGAASPWAPFPMAMELAHCQRFYATLPLTLVCPVAAISLSGFAANLTYPTTMRALPATTAVHTGGNVTLGATFSNSATSGTTASMAGTPAAGNYETFTLQLSADL